MNPKKDTTFRDGMVRWLRANYPEACDDVRDALKDEQTRHAEGKESENE